MIVQRTARPELHLAGVTSKVGAKGQVVIPKATKSCSSPGATQLSWEAGSLGAAWPAGFSRTALANLLEPLP